MKRVFSFVLCALALAGGCERRVAAPETSAAYLEARRAAEEGDWARAARHYRQVLDAHPRFAAAHIELGLLCDERLGDPIGAVYHFRRCLELEPSADKRRVLEDYIERAKLSLASKLPQAGSVDTSELVRLQNQNTALTVELTALKSRLAELEAAAKPSPATGAVAVVVPPPPPPPAATNTVAALEPARPRTHKVAKGDTLSSLALKYYGSRAAWERIYLANKSSLPNKDQLRIGQELVLP